MNSAKAGMTGMAGMAGMAGMESDGGGWRLLRACMHTMDRMGQGRMCFANMMGLDGSEADEQADGQADRQTDSIRLRAVAVAVADWGVRE